MDKYFMSQDFIGAISLLEKLLSEEKIKEIDFENGVGFVIGVSLKYYMLFNGLKLFSIEKMKDFVKKIITYIVDNEIKNFNSYEFNEYIDKEYVNEVFNVLNIDKNKLSNNSQIKFNELIAVALERYDYKFHGFNGYFLDSIREKGIDPNSKEEQADIVRINEMFKKYGIKMGLGWSEFDYGQVSYSKTPIVSYDYAIRSPEWFSKLLGNRAFIENDYDMAKHNLLVLAENHGFSEEDKKVLFDFFDRNWQKYSSQKAMVALIQDRRSNDELLGLIDDYRKSKILDDVYRLLPFVFYESSVDCKSSDKIDTTSALYMELPRPNELIEMIALYNNQSKK